MTDYERQQITRAFNNVLINETQNCPNKPNHVSAWPAYDRELCPYCRKVYVLKK